MNNQKNFFKNAFKNLIKEKLQLITVVILVFLTSFVFSLSFSSTSRIKESNNEFKSSQKSNLHDFVFDLSNTVYINDFDNDLFSKKFSNQNMRNDFILNYLKDKLSENDISFNFDRIDSIQTTVGNDLSLKIFGLNPDQQIDKLVVSQGMSVEEWKTYTQATNINTLRWVYVNEQFAKANNIKINDIIRLQEDSYGSSILVENSEKQDVDLSLYDGYDINYWIEKTKYLDQNWFQVVGYGSSADMTAPIIDETKPLPNTKKEGVFYIDPINLGYTYKYYDSLFPNNDFSLSDTNNLKVWYSDSELINKQKISTSSEFQKEAVYVAKFNSTQNDIKSSTNLINEYITNLNKAKEINLYATFKNSLNQNLPIAIVNKDTSYKYYLRTTLLDKVILFYTMFSYAIMIVTLTIGVIMLVIMISKKLKQSFGQVGVLRSLGVTRFSLIWSNSLYSLFVSITGGILGYIIGISSQELIIKVFNNYFSLQMISFNFSWQSLIVVILGLFLFLELITIITCFFAFVKFNSLEMINYKSKSTTNNFNLYFKKLFTRKNNFNKKFKGAILSNSILKLISVFGVMLISSGLITFGIAIPNVLKDNANKTYQNVKYNNIIEYQSPLYNVPTSFYKTYNPYLNYDNLTTENILKMYINNEISSNIYQALTDLSTMNNMTYKSLDLNYLTNQNLTIKSNSTIDPKLFYKTIIMNLWPDLKNYGLDEFWNKESLIDILTSQENIKQNIEKLEKIRQFYLKYKTSVGMNIIREDYVTKTGNRIRVNPSKKEELISNKDIKNLANVLTYIESSGKLENDEIYEKNLYEYSESLNNSQLQFQIIKTIVPIYNWFVTFFYNNLQQAMLQGIYNSSPLTIKKIIEEQIDSNKDFRVTFGINPFDVKNEDIGIMINGYVNDQSLKIYGVSQDNKTLNLSNSKNKNLLSLLSINSNNILINQSLAKRLKVKTGDEIKINQIIEALSKNKEIIPIESWDSSTLNALDENGYTSSSNLYNSSILEQNYNGWTNNLIDEDNNGLVYNSQIDFNSESLVGPTSMSQGIVKGDLSITNQITTQTYKVVGIVDQYGDNKAWINNDFAKTESKYNLSEEMLFGVFKKEWENPINPSSESIILSDFLNSLNESLSNKEQFEAFVNWTKNNNNDYLKLFENEYPIYNYKTSNDSNITDYSKGISSMQKYGDYSMIGLNGGVSNNVSYPAYANSSLSSIIVINGALKVIERINQTANIITYFVIVIFIFLSVLIIFLTMNLIIEENAKIIAVMKILGYKQKYLARMFIGIYIPVTLISSIIGFCVGWLILLLVISNLQAIIVLPLIFRYWYIIFSIFVSWMLYIISVSLSWNNLKKINMLIAVQGG